MLMKLTMTGKTKIICSPDEVDSANPLIAIYIERYGGKKVKTTKKGTQYMIHKDLLNIKREEPKETARREKTEKKRSTIMQGAADLKRIR